MRREAHREAGARRSEHVERAVGVQSKTGRRLLVLSTFLRPRPPIDQRAEDAGTEAEQRLLAIEADAARSAARTGRAAGLVSMMPRRSNLPLNSRAPGEPGRAETWAVPISRSLDCASKSSNSDTLSTMRPDLSRGISHRSPSIESLGIGRSKSNSVGWVPGLSARSNSAPSSRPSSRIALAMRGTRTTFGISSRRYSLHFGKSAARGKITACSCCVVGRSRYHAAGRRSEPR
jgi:hypothetical protein